MAPPTHRPFFIFIVIFAVLSVFFSLSKGSTYISVDQLFFASPQNSLSIILSLRLYRTAAAFICGGLLALAGLLMQLLLENPLADPYILGISGGAALGTLSLIFLGISVEWLLLGAWGGSLISILFILALAKNHRWNTNNMLLIGVALAFGFSAIISAILLFSPTTTLHTMLYWLSGDLNDATFPTLGCIILLFGFVLSMGLAPGLNILSRGDLEARSLGIATKKYKVTLYLLSSLLTATAVTIAGCIGFVGLIIPHLTRRLIGSNYHYTIATAILLGGTLLTLADTLARCVFAPTQIPVGIFLAIVGVPVFIGLLQQ